MLIKENDLIAIQDESVAGWQSSRMRGFGRKIQHSIIGGIISDLKRKSETLVVDKHFPSAVTREFPYAAWFSSAGWSVVRTFTFPYSDLEKVKRFVTKWKEQNGKEIRN